MRLCLLNGGGRGNARPPPISPLLPLSPAPHGAAKNEEMQPNGPEKASKGKERRDNVCQCGSVGDGRRHMEQCAVGTSIYGRKNVRLHFFEGCTCAVQKLFFVHQAFWAPLSVSDGKYGKLGRCVCMQKFYELRRRTLLLLPLIFRVPAARLLCVYVRSTLFFFPVLRFPLRMVKWHGKTNEPTCR